MHDNSAREQVCLLTLVSTRGRIFVFDRSAKRKSVSESATKRPADVEARRLAHQANCGNRLLHARPKRIPSTRPSLATQILSPLLQQHPSLSTGPFPPTPAASSLFAHTRRGPCRFPTPRPPGGAGRAPPPAASPRRKPPPPRRRRPPAPARDPTPPPSRTRAAAGPPPARSRTASSPWSQGRGGSFGSASGAGAEVSPSHPPGPRPQHACLSRLRSIRRINPKAFVPQGTWLRPSAPTASVGGGHQRDNKLAQRIVTASSPL